MEGVKRLILDKDTLRNNIQCINKWNIKGKYLFLIPMYNSVNPLFSLSLANLINKLNALDIKYKIIHEIGTYLPVARETLSKQAFLESIGEYEWLIWLDSDVTFDTETMLYLMESAEKKEYDIISPLIVTRIAPHIPLIYKNNDYMQIPPYKEWVQADAVGFGCIIMHRLTLEKIPRPHFQTEYNRKGKLIGEDIYFFRKAKKYGMALGVNLFVKFGHVGGIVWNDQR